LHQTYRHTIAHFPKRLTTFVNKLFSLLFDTWIKINTQDAQEFMEYSTDRQVVLPFLFSLRWCNLGTTVNLWTVRQDAARAFLFRLPTASHHTSIYLLSFINMNTAVLPLEDAHATWLNSSIDIPNHSILRGLKL